MTVERETPDPIKQADETLNRLADASQPMSRASLRGLSGLTARQFSGFGERWDALPLARRRRVVRDMVELAEDNVELDFAEVLKRALRDPDADIRRTAVDGLWESDDRSLPDEFIRLAERDSNTAVRAAAASALARFAYQHELGRLDGALGERIREVLTALVENEDEPLDVRRRALESLAFISGDEVHDLIADAYREVDDKMRASAIHAMGRTCDPAWLDVLINELKSPNAEHRFEAARACGEMEDAAPVPDLIKLIQDPDREVRLAAIGALGQIGGTPAKRALVQASRSDDPVVANAAADALDELNFIEDPIAFRIQGRRRDEE